MKPTLCRLFAVVLFPLMSFAASASSHLIYIGPATRDATDGSRGIYSLRLDGKTGKLSDPVLAAPLFDSFFLTLSPDHRHLYSVERMAKSVEEMKGGVAAFSIDPDSGALTALNEQPSGGNAAIHLAVDATGKMLVMANYASGTVAAFPIGADGRLGERSSSYQLSGMSPAKPERQTAPFPHGVAFSPDNRFVYIPSLGQDKVLKFKVDPAAAMIELADPAAHTTAPGAGPRHAVFSADGKFYYVVNELDNTVDVLACEPRAGTLRPVQKITTLPADFTGATKTAEIRVHPNGRFVYASNRGHDSIAVYARDGASGRLKLVEIASSGGKAPRNFALSPDGAWMVCSNLDSNTIVSFAVDPATGRIAPTGSEVKLDRPICVLFVD